MMLATPASAAVTFYTNSTAYFAALANANASVGPDLDFEGFELGFDVQTGQPLGGNLGIQVNEGSGVPLPVVGNTFNRFGDKSLEADRDGDTGTPDFFFAGDSIGYSTGDNSTNAFSVYINIVQSQTDQLFLEYFDPFGIESQIFTGGSGAYDTSTFYFLGVIADRGNVFWRFGGLAETASGFNVDNINIQAPGGPPAIPEPASWALLIAGFGLTGTVLRRRRVAVA